MVKRKELEMLTIRNAPRVTVWANSLDAYVPEVWAQESLMVLYSNMVMARLVHRDFENEIQQYGDVVNTRRPGTFKAKRKTDADSVTIQDATATNVAVPLDQHLHTSFMIKDGEESKGFKNLRDEFLVPAVISLAQQVDQILFAQTYQFLANSAGFLGTDADDDTVRDVVEVLNVNKVPPGPRYCVIPPGIQRDFQGVDNWMNANTVGDDGSALRSGNLGTKYDLTFFMTQNAPSIAAGQTVLADGQINKVGGYPAGTTTIVCDTWTGGDPVAGEWCVIAGDMTPQLILTITGSGPITGMTISPGLRRAVVDNAIITATRGGAINLPANYAAAYGGDLVVDGFSAATDAPKAGQLISLDADPDNLYAALDTPTSPTQTVLALDRPLGIGVDDNKVVGIGPAGDYGFAFHRNCMALVNRPLALPAAGTGARSAVASADGISLRIVMTYDGTKQGHLVTVDLLCGVKVLDTNLGALMYA